MVSRELEIRDIIVGLLGELETQYSYKLDSRKRAIKHFTEALNKGKDEEGYYYSYSDMEDIKGIIEEDRELLNTYKHRLKDIKKVLDYLCE